MSKCTHIHTTAGRHYGFCGSVAVYPYTDENRAASGCITYTETCRDCGAKRSVNANQRHYEYSPWGPSSAEQEASARRERESAERALLACGEQMLREHRVHIIRITDTQVQLEMDGQVPSRYLSTAAIDAAAAQQDTGDGLVPFYLALQARVRAGRLNPRPGAIYL